MTSPGLSGYGVGYAAGAATTSGNNNIFFGFSAGFANTTGSNNSLLGSNSNVGSCNLSFAAAIGANSVVTTSNTIVLGRNLGQDTVQIPGVLNVANQYNLGGSRVLSVAGTDNLFVGESAGGGQTSTGGQFTLDGTNGQTIAGQRAVNAAFSLHAGFWNPDQFAPTAAEVTVGGRITTADRRGIRSVRITITGTNGESRTRLSGTFGYFRFADIPSGATYVITVSAKRYQFKETSQVHTVVEDTDNINFVAAGEL